MATFEEWEEEKVKKPLMGPVTQLCTLVGAGLALTALLVIPISYMGFFYDVHPDQYTTYLWVKRKAQFLYFGCVFFLKIFAWECYFPTYLSAFLLQDYVRYGFFAAMVFSGSMTCYITTWPIFKSYKLMDENSTLTIFLVVMVVFTLFVGCIVAPVFIPKYNMFDRNRVLRHINWWCWLAFSAAIINRWVILMMLALTFPEGTIKKDSMPVYATAIGFYVVLFIVQFLEYLRVHRINKEIVYIDLEFMNLLLWYTTFIFVFVVTVSFYAGCGTCLQVQQLGEGVLVGRKCWWSGKVLETHNIIDAIRDSKLDKAIQKVTPQAEQTFLNLEDILEMYIPEQFREEKENMLKDPLTNKLLHYEDKYIYKAGQKLYRRDKGYAAPRCLVSISWAPCLKQDQWLLLKPKCIGVLIYHGFVLTTAQCFESRYGFMTYNKTVSEALPSEIIIRYYSRVLRVPIYQNTLIYVGNRSRAQRLGKKDWGHNQLVLIRLPRSIDNEGHIIENQILEDNYHHKPPYGRANIKSLKHQTNFTDPTEELDGDVSFVTLQFNVSTNEEVYLPYDKDQVNRCSNTQTDTDLSLRQKIDKFFYHDYNPSDYDKNTGMYVALCIGYFNSKSAIAYPSVANVLTGSPLVRIKWNNVTQGMDTEVIGLFIKPIYSDLAQMMLFYKLSPHHEDLKTIMPYIQVDWE